MFTIRSYKKPLILLLITAGIVFGGMIHVKHVQAEVVNPTATPKISFTFDDGKSSSLLSAAPVLSQYGFTGTDYIITGCMDVVVPATCKTDSTETPMMTWNQVKELKNTYGWEIGSHTVSHPLLTKLSATKLKQELSDSKKALQAQGINATSFASPYGDYNAEVLAEVAKYYTSHRGFADTGYNTWPYNNYLLRVQQVQEGVSVDTVKGYIDQAVTDNTWLILVFHDIKDIPNSNPSYYQYSTADLSAIASYVKQKNIKVTNISDGLVSAKSSDNLVTNPISGNKLGNGWTTDGGSSVSIDTNNHASVPEPKKSIKVTAQKDKNVHIFSPKVTINPKSTYVIKGYVNINKIDSGGAMGFYIDEYDVNGNWISGQYKQTIDTKYIKDLSFMYSASSNLVARASLQVIIINNSGVVAFISNIQWIETTSGPPPTPQPNQINLIVNGDFEQGFSGWSTDNNQAIMLDANNNGSINSVKSSAKLTNINTKSVHLFSDKISVSSNTSYQVSCDLNIKTLTNEIGFYIDEYDVNGNWVSGKYLFSKKDTLSGTIKFAYVPSSKNVAKASLQIIVASGVGTEVYADNIQWKIQA